MSTDGRSVITDETVDLVASAYVHAEGGVHDAIRAGLEALVAAGYELRSRDELRTWHAERDYECAAHSEGLTCCVDRLLGDEPPEDKLDAGLADAELAAADASEAARTRAELVANRVAAGDPDLAWAEYHAALDNLNAVRAENHLTGWSAHHLRHHLVVDHGVSRLQLLDNELDGWHRQAHEREASR